MFAVTEPDGVRIIGPDVCDFLQKVPSKAFPGNVTIFEADNRATSVHYVHISAWIHLSVSNTL